jgi:DNA polymerase III delta prime subunit
MLRRRMRLILVVIGVLATAVFAVATEIAVQDLPAVIEDHRGLAWPLFILLVVLLAALAVWEYRHGEQNPVPSVPSTSAAAPFVVATTSTAERDAQNRSRMLQRVRNFWIKGVLEQSLYHIARIDLQLEARPAAVARVWDVIIQKSGRPAYSLPPGTRISQVFDEMDQAVLILGDPGSGKTTTLLELAKELLDRADWDPGHPIPIVFNLSSWAIARRPLVEWMVSELQLRYVVPPTISRTWIESQQVLPLLDGLDEVVQEHRAKCLETINQFRDEHGLLPIAVCSRIADYEALREAKGVSGELRLEEAIYIEPLTRAQVAKYLRDVGRPLDGVRTALRDDETLWELLSTPLLLDIMSLTYGYKSAREVRQLGQPHERRARLFTAYTHEMFKRRGRESRYRVRESVRWLGWLGRTLTRRNQTLFRLEWMQPDWLSSQKQRWAVTKGVALVVGLAAAVLVGLLAGLLYRRVVPHPYNVASALIFGLIAGVACGLASYDRSIRPAEGSDWSWTTLRDFLIDGAIIGVEHGIYYGLLSGVVAMLLGSTIGLPGRDAGVGTGLIALIASLILLLGISLNIGLTVGLLRWLTAQRGVSETVPEEDVKGAARNVLIGALVSAGLSGLIYGVTLGSIGNFFGRQGIGLRTAAILAFTLGLVVALRTGGAAYLQHLALRAVLVYKDYAPRNYKEFLDTAAERLFLRKVGRGYIFVHRLLLEHFAKSEELDELEEEGPATGTRGRPSLGRGSPT